MIAQVSINGSTRAYSYECDLPAKVGDEVIVPVGKDNRETNGKIVGFTDTNTTGFELKSVIRLSPEVSSEADDFAYDGESDASDASDKVIFDLSDREGKSPITVKLPKIEGDDRQYQINVSYAFRNDTHGFVFGRFQPDTHKPIRREAEYLSYKFNTFDVEALTVNLPAPFGTPDPSAKFQFDIKKVADKVYEISNFKRK